MLYKGTQEHSESSLSRQFVFTERVHQHPKETSKPTHTGSSLGFHSKVGNRNVFLHCLGIFLNCQVLRNGPRKMKERIPGHQVLGMQLGLCINKSFTKLGRLKLRRFME